MKLKFTLFLFLFLSYQQVDAQLPDNSVAPDFTVTDVNGETHNLYDILAEGKTVILDIFSTWCGPCWAYHQTHTLADIYEAYGPDGTNDMFVMAIEADNQTNEDCLYGQDGCNNTSIGDWTEGVPYPVINSNQINGPYAINYFPTIYIIHPNRLISELGQLSYDNIVEARNDFPTLSEGINPEALVFRGQNGSVCNPLWPAAPYFLISNMGMDTIHSCDINVYKNGELIYESQVTESVAPFLPLAEVQVQPTLISEDTKFELKVENINGDPAQSLSTYSEINFATNNAVYVSAQLDANSSADGNRYEIINQAGDVLSSIDLLANNSLVEKSHFLDEGGCYTFKIYDSNGDGIDGEVRVTDGDGKLIYLNNGAFSVGESEFNVATVSSVSATLNENSIVIVPNPIADLLQIEIDSRTTNDLEICVVNVFGQMIGHTVTKNESVISFDASNWTEGIYFVFIQDGNNKISKQVVKN